MASGAAAPEHLTFAEARARILAAVRPLPPEAVALDDASGRVLRADVRAPHPLPPFANSAMDGVVVRAADCARAAAGAPVRLRVVATLAAGHPVARALAPGEAMRIMTGAPLPEGGDAIVPVEELAGAGDGTAVIARPVAAGEHVRPAGADLAADAVALAAGTRLGPHDVALLAALGHATPEVAPRPRVVVLSTGDELRDVDAAPEPGTIRDSNTPLLRALVAEAGGVVIRAERLPDQPAAVTAAIRRAFGDADLVLSVGGVSAGDFDPVKLALGALGGIALWRVAMKPGRPQAFGAPDGRLFHGLPGNPASVACVFDTLVRPALLALQACAELERARVTARAAEDVPSRAGRTDFVRVRLAPEPGGLVAHPVAGQISGHLVPQARAHGLLEVPEERDVLRAGETAVVRLWRWPEPSRS